MLNPITICHAPCPALVGSGFIVRDIVIVWYPNTRFALLNVSKK